MRASIRGALALALLGACKFTPPGAAGDAAIGTDDAPQLADAFIVDAGVCTGESRECVGGTTLRECDAGNPMPRDTPCFWGCSVLGDPHCAELQPAGGAVMPSDLVPAGLGTKTIPVGVTIDTETGEITGIRPAGEGVRNDIDFAIRNGVGVFRFKELTLDGGIILSIRVQGDNALALVAHDGITVKARLDASGDCSANTSPGGGVGGGVEQLGGGMGGGEAGAGSAGDASGGGGGGNGGTGGAGGQGKNFNATSGGGAFGDASIPALRGGGGGGGGGGTGARGGPGGGAIQLVSNGTIRIEGGLEVDGCGGRGTPGGDGGAGGGGAGGTILLEAPFVQLAAFSFLSANGGGGGGARSGQSGVDGDVLVDTANGGAAGTKGGTGGSGGSGSTLNGGAATGDDAGGGGGGAVGRIRINTYTIEAAQVSGQAIVTPSPSTSVADVQ